MNCIIGSILISGGVLSIAGLILFTMGTMPVTETFYKNDAVVTSKLIAAGKTDVVSVALPTGSKPDAHKVFTLITTRPSSDVSVFVLIEDQSGHAVASHAISDGTYNELAFEQITNENYSIRITNSGPGPVLIQIAFNVDIFPLVASSAGFVLFIFGAIILAAGALLYFADRPKEEDLLLSN